MNGNSTGIVPTIDLATNNNGGFAYPYPVMGGFGNSGFGGFGDSGALWLIVLLALIWNGNNGNGGFFGGNGGFDNGYAWLSNGQKDIMSQTSDGFNSLHISNQVEGIRDGISSLSNQLCNCCADMNSTVSNGFYNSEIAAANRQMANMNQIYGLSTQLASASADNRLGIANLNSTILAENCADRAALADSTQRIITNATDNTRAVLDKLCQLELDNKQSRIQELERQVLIKDLAASQTAQTAELRTSQATTANQLIAELRACPIPAQAVYGNTPVFTCPSNNGCGCGNFTTSQFI